MEMNKNQKETATNQQKSVRYIPSTSGHTSTGNVFAHKEEKEIWEAFCSGNNQAFSYLYNRYGQLLFRYGTQLTTDRELVQDAIHSLFLELRTRETKQPQIISIKSYLLKALYRTLLRLLKKERRFSLFWQNDTEVDLQVTFSADAAVIGNDFTQEQQQAIARSLNHLPKRQKEAMVYYFYEGMDYEEIAFIMGLKKLHSARKLIYKGIDGIKKELGEAQDSQKLIALFPTALLSAAHVSEGFTYLS